MPAAHVTWGPSGVSLDLGEGSVGGTCGAEADAHAAARRVERTTRRLSSVVISTAVADSSTLAEAVAYLSCHRYSSTCGC